MRALILLWTIILIIHGCLGVALRRNIKLQSNADERGHYYESDIVLHLNQHHYPLNGNGFNSYWRWENGIIPYEFPVGQHSLIDQKIILSAMDEVSLWTCIKFVERTTQADYLSFQNNPDGCWSFVGRMRGLQPLNLHTGGGCVNRGTAMHELLHALGFFHSHSDLSRDEYIRVDYENIPDTAVPNFATFSNNYVTNYGHGYDYESIMHFGEYSFTKNGLPTLTPLLPYEGVIGQRNKLSDKDIAKVNMMYSCPETATTTTAPPKATRGAFQLGKLP